MSQGNIGITDTNESTNPNLPAVGGMSIKIPITNPNHPTDFENTLLLMMAIENIVMAIPPKQ